MKSMFWAVVGTFRVSGGRVVGSGAFQLYAVGGFDQLSLRTYTRCFGVWSDSPQAVRAGPSLHGVVFSIPLWKVCDRRKGNSLNTSRDSANADALGDINKSDLLRSLFGTYSGQQYRVV